MNEKAQYDEPNFEEPDFPEMEAKQKEKPLQLKPESAGEKLKRKFEELKKESVGLSGPEPAPQKVSHTAKTEKSQEKKSASAPEQNEGDYIDVLTYVLYLHQVYSFAWGKCREENLGSFANVLMNCDRALESSIEVYLDKNTVSYQSERLGMPYFPKEFPDLKYIRELPIDKLFETMIFYEDFLHAILEKQKDNTLAIFSSPSLLRKYLVSRMQDCLGRAIRAKQSIPWVCEQCYYTAEGAEPPSSCPHCESDRAYFRPIQTIFPYDVL